MQLTFYHRHGCHLCDDLDAAIRAYARQRGLVATLSVTYCDIDAQPSWAEFYGERIPVVTHDGDVILEGNPSPQAVQAALAALDWRKG